MKFLPCLALAALCLVAPVCAQETNELDSILNLSAFTEESELQKQLNQSTKVASGKALGTRETPGIISVVTSNEILKSGARDITDILRLVPGFEIMQDLQFVTGVGFRGSWANEGKVLFLLDGHQLNDLLYQTVPLINNFPVDAIDKIEIIRGPGSAVYGGSAEYAVINIITKQATLLNGVSVYGIGGFHKSTTGRSNGGFMAAQKGKKFSWDLGGFRSKGIVSDQPYTDLIGDVPDPVDLSEISKANSTNINLGLKAGGLSFRGIYSGYDTSDPVYRTAYNNFSSDLKYDWKVNDKLVITPQFSYYNQVPWSYDSLADGDVKYEVKATRAQGSLSLSQTVGRKINLNYGGLFFKDKASSDLDPESFPSGKLEMTNYAVFAQGLYKHRLFNLTAGFRYEHNSKAGGAFVPRLAFTKKIENFHFKVLYSEAFRTPAIENINLAANNPDPNAETMIPEKSKVGELELGYQFTPDMLLSLNAFTISTKRVIIYRYDPIDDIDWYENFRKTGSSGIEAIYSIQQKRWNAKLTYTYTASQKTDSSVYYVPQTKTSYLGFPKHKFMLTSSFDLTKKLSLNPTLVVSGKRFAYTESDDDGNPISNELPGYTLLNLFLNYSELVPRLNVGFGVYDVLNEKPGIPQPYNGGYLPIPGRSREFVVKLSYQLNFKGQ